MHTSRSRVLLLAAMVALGLSAPALAKKTLIFVVDVSGSMTASRLAQPVVRSLIAFIGNNFVEGDNLVLCSFGDSFYVDKELRAGRESDLPGFLPLIERLNFDDQHTYMTLALSEAASLASRYRAESPETPVYVYLYTDGRNDPPPYVKNPLTFETIMAALFKNYKPAGTYLYIVTLGTEVDSPLANLVDSLNKAHPGKARIVNMPATPDRDIEPPPEPTAGPKETKPAGPKPPVWPYLLAVAAALAAALVVFVVLKNIPKFPRDAYLTVLDESGNALNRFNLKSRQKFASGRLTVSGDLPVRGVVRNCFTLRATKGGAVIIQANLKQNPVKLTATDTELTPGRVQTLSPGDEFSAGSVKMRYDRGS